MVVLNVDYQEISTNVLSFVMQSVNKRVYKKKTKPHIFLCVEGLTR